MAISAKAFTTSGTTVIHTGPVNFYGVSLRNAAGTTDNVVTVFDNTAASGTVLASFGPLATAGAANSFAQVVLPVAIRAGIGITVAITGTTPNIVGSVFAD